MNYTPKSPIAIPQISTAIPSTFQDNNRKYRCVSSFDILYFNAWSIVNKRDELDHLLKSNTIQLLFITETWLRPHYIDSFIVDSSKFSIHRQDRLENKGGGVAVVYSNTLAPKISPIEIDHNTCTGFNILAIDLYTNSHKYSRFILVYLPPSNSTNITTMQQLLKILNKLKTKYDVYIMGDFNLSNINWNTPSQNIT